MSSPQDDVEFCPTRANLHWPNTQYDQVQFADFDNVQVTKIGNVAYFKASDDEDDNAPEVDGEGESRL